VPQTTFFSGLNM